MVDFRVATYNVLSSHLAEPSRFPECDPKHLHAPTRLQRVKAKLQEEVDRGAVVCLQEVSILWAGEFHVFFMARGYAFVTANYGNPHNGYMGVALAWSLSKYEAVTVDITRVSDTRVWGRKSTPLPSSCPSPGGPPTTPVRRAPAPPTTVPAPASPNSVLTTIAAWTGTPSEGGTGGGEWGSPLKALMRLAGRGVKRPREEEEERGDSADRGGGGGGVSGRGREGEEPEDVWEMAKKRFNQAIFVRLRPKIVAAPAATVAGGNGAPNGAGTLAPNGTPANGSSGIRGTLGGPPVFCVGTYHMPCLFNHRPVMVMHTSMVVKHLLDLACSNPLVIAGDFNFNPASECYKIVTQGDLSIDSPDFPDRPGWEKNWSPATGAKLMSAYREVEGKEPDFTNNAKVEQWPRFIDTLDYIFHTPGLIATKVLPLKHRNEVKGPFPSETEPSDHVLLAAEYRVSCEL